MKGRAPDIDVRELHGLGELEQASQLLEDIWGPGSSVVEVHLLRAFEHSGNYVAGAFADGGLIGATAAMLGRRGDQVVLHSHVTGVREEWRSHHVGLGLKQHQWDWAKQRRVSFVEWTFDPLVSRNAWFNLGRLGARAVEYLPSFYGVMTDAINAGDESDRLLARWHVAEPPPALPRGTADLTVAVPDDIVALRQSEPAEALRWRHRVRDQLGGAMELGALVLGFDRVSGYLVKEAS